jgi:hypothetical protein
MVIGLFAWGRAAWYCVVDRFASGLKERLLLAWIPLGLWCALCLSIDAFGGPETSGIGTIIGLLSLGIGILVWGLCQIPLKSWILLTGLGGISLFVPGCYVACL